MEIELNLPIDINSIKLRDYQKYIKIVDANKEATNDFLDIKMLEIFCDLQYKDIEKLPLSAFNDALEYMTLIFQAKTPLVRKFEMIGTDDVTVELGFVPNLDKLSLGEYIDLNSYFEDIENLHKAMAVLFRPVIRPYIGKTNYRIAEYEGTEFYSELMKDMPLGLALGARVFFYRLGMKLSKRILSYSHEAVEMVETLSEVEKHNLQKNMDGINIYMLLLEDKLLTLNNPLNYQFTKR